MTPQEIAAELTVYVYTVTNTITGECYVGISKDPEARWKRHRSQARKPVQRFHRALAKYGPGVFRWQVVDSKPSAAAAKDAERALIAQIKPAYNLTDGGDGVLGWKASDETKAKMSAAHKGKPNLALRGYKQTPEHVFNAAITRVGKPNAMRGRKLTPQQLAKRIGKPSPLRGRKHSPEHIAKNSAAHVGKKHSEETKAKMRESHLRRHRDARTSGA